MKNKIKTILEAERLKTERLTKSWRADKNEHMAAYYTGKADGFKEAIQVIEKYLSKGS
jgi:hypothetical protein